MSSTLPEIIPQNTFKIINPLDEGLNFLELETEMVKKKAVYFVYPSNNKVRINAFTDIIFHIRQQCDGLSHMITYSVDDCGRIYVWDTPLVDSA